MLDFKVDPNMAENRKFINDLEYTFVLTAKAVEFFLENEDIKNALFNLKIVSSVIDVSDIGEAAQYENNNLKRWVVRVKGDIQQSNGKMKGVIGTLITPLKKQFPEQKKDLDGIKSSNSLMQTSPALLNHLQECDTNQKLSFIYEYIAKNTKAKRLDPRDTDHKQTIIAVRDATDRFENALQGTNKPCAVGSMIQTTFMSAQTGVLVPDDSTARTIQQKLGNQCAIGHMTVLYKAPTT